MPIAFKNRSPAPPLKSDLQELQQALKRLDGRLACAVIAAEQVYEVSPGSDPYRGLYISPDEIARLLACHPNELKLMTSDGMDHKLFPENGRWFWLRDTFGLSDLDVEVILIALASEIDLRYERLYAYLQDDVTRKRPTIDLCLNLLCDSADSKTSSQARFAPDAPLIRNSLLQLIPDPNQVEPPAFAYYLKLDNQIVRFLLGQDGLDPGLSSFCRLSYPTADLDTMFVAEDMKSALLTLVARSIEAEEPLTLNFHGARGAEKRQAAEALATQAGLSLLSVDLRLALTAGADFGQTLRRVFREASLKNAFVYLDHADVLRSDERASEYEILLEEVGQHDGAVIIASTQATNSAGRCRAGLLTMHFPPLDFLSRRACWETNLRAAGVAARDADIDVLATRFRLNPGQIRSAVADARNAQLWHQANSSCKAPGAEISAVDLFSAARSQSGHRLSKLARKVEPKYRWTDIVLPTDQLSQLKEISDQVKYRYIVYGDWGFDRKLSLGKGLNVLFAGPPGTGKTMAAEVIASELQLDLYKIDLAQVVSKYIGETEKNLDSIFTAAESANAILFFDEADALFGKRSEVKDSHDRYANIEIGYLLQKMEEYEGVAILATNLRQNLDDAFSRRIQVVIDFPFPDEPSRLKIWKGMFPVEAPLGTDVDFIGLSREIKLAGGNIKNIALAAAFYAASDGQVVHMPHLLEAARREHQKLGRAWNGLALDAAGSSVA
jgi:AAA+ superfamily predicted ATPase